MSLEDPEAAREKREAFLDKLADLGYTVEEVTKRPVVYKIDGRLVSVRSKDVPRVDSSGTRRFWYDVSTNVLEEVDLVVYLMTEPEYFLLIPSGYLRGLIDRMYLANGKETVRVFDVDWDDLSIVLDKGEREDVNRFYCNLNEEEEYPQF